MGSRLGNGISPCFFTFLRGGVWQAIRKSFLFFGEIFLLLVYCEVAKYEVFFFLAVLGLVILPAASAAVQQRQGEQCMYMRSVIHGMKVLRAISIDLTLRATMCQWSWAWQGSCTAQHLAKPYCPHSQEVPAGEPRYIKGIYAEFTLAVIVVS